MKKLNVLITALICILLLAGCEKQPPVQVRTVEGNFRTYYEMSDGTWEYNGYIYKYRLEITGRQPCAVRGTTYVYLSNIAEIPFGRAMMASGLSSRINDYFKAEEAVLVEIR